MHTSSTDYKTPEGNIDWDAFRRAQVQNGEICYHCGSFLFTWKGEPALAVIVWPWRMTSVRSCILIASVARIATMWNKLQTERFGRMEITRSTAGSAASPTSFRPR
jgi:hypothetical protein